MCLAVPMKLIAVREDGTATADLDGARCAVNVSLIADPRVGDYVIVHAGFAIQTLDPREAKESLKLWKEVLGGSAPDA